MTQGEVTQQNGACCREIISPMSSVSQDDTLVFIFSPEICMKNSLIV